MKKIMLILAITGVLISCSSKDEIIKKETVAEVLVVKDEAIIPLEEAVVEITEVVMVEVEKPVLTDEDYKSVSEPIKKLRKKPTPKPINKKLVIEEKVVPVEIVMETSVDDALNIDVDKQVANIKTEVKVVDAETPKEESGSNKTLFGILGVILVAAAAMFVFKKK